jgi:uncharacterized protein DUF4082/concanavalin A-like lectin/glucanase superfamily protein/putative glycosyl hydrolase-like family 15 (GHL15) protein
MLVKKIIHLLAFMLTSIFWVNINAAERTIQNFATFYGQLTDDVTLAKYDMIAVNRFMHNDYDTSTASSTWVRLKQLNPNILIFNYQLGLASKTFQDDWKPLYLNTISRYKKSRGHSQGNIYYNNPHYILKNSQNKTMISLPYKELLLDFGNPAFSAYWTEATKTDIVNKPWRADGIFLDNMMTTAKNLTPLSYGEYPAKYPNANQWNAALEGHINRITTSFNKVNQKLFLNRGYLAFKESAQSWLATDRLANPPFAAMDEGFIAVGYGGGDVQFYNHEMWKRSIDTVYKLKNIRAAVYSHSDLIDNASGISNWGQPVNSWDVFYYSLASYLMARGESNNVYFFYNHLGSSKKIPWYDEYEQLNKLGKPVGKYSSLNQNGVAIYLRQYEHGYVYVNPNSYLKSSPGKNTARSIKLPQPAKKITHDVVNKNWGKLPNIQTFNLPANRGAIFYTVNLTTSGIQNSSNNQIAIDDEQQSSASSRSTTVNSKQDANVPKLPSKEEVSSDSSEPFPNLSTDISLVAHWPLDSIADEITQELTGNANDGSVNGNPQAVIGNHGRAVKFIDAEDYILISDSPSLHFEKELTLSFWMKIDQYPRFWQVIIDKSDYAKGAWHGFYIDMQADGRLRLVSNAASSTTFRSSRQIPKNVWTHVTLKIDQKISTFYIDGKFSGSVASRRNYQLSNSNDMLIGRNSLANRTFQGALDDVRVYDTALSETEIKEVLLAGNFPKNNANPDVILDSACPCSIWGNADVPENPSEKDSGSVELGVKFKSDEDGYIEGIRFYKGKGNTGKHVGNLWTSSGQLLASAIFTAETAVGWQQVNFAAPVAIKKDTVYVASYHAPNGHYANDNKTFRRSGVDKGSLHLLKTGVSGKNGVYVYSKKSSFPKSTYLSTNYWVDVVFNTGEPKDEIIVADDDSDWDSTTNVLLESICCSIWSEFDAPINASEKDPGAVELGVKFISDEDGVIEGIRFYKGKGNTGKHVGNLWASGGRLLASATFTNETAAGWQQVKFAKPIAIKKDTVYVASYHAPKGHYASDKYTFAKSGIDNGPLHLLKTGVNGKNGVYAYGRKSNFPRSTYLSTNYWVDVIFNNQLVATNDY